MIRSRIAASLTFIGAVAVGIALSGSALADGQNGGMRQRCQFALCVYDVNGQTVGILDGENRALRFMQGNGTRSNGQVTWGCFHEQSFSMRASIAPGSLI
jgi:hypothetical protein